ncbi:Ribosome maturation factor RimP [Bienertia sinuspersici]
MGRLLAHYSYGWFALYFNTNYAVYPSPLGPLMVFFFARKGQIFLKVLKRIVSLTRVIVLRLDVLCEKKKNTFVFDDDNLDHIQMSYLSSVRSGYVSLPHYDSFSIEPYLPYQFSRQFGFFQDNLLLFQGNMSRVCAPYLSLEWHKLKMIKFYDWWIMVTIKYLRHNIDKLCSAVESSSSYPRGLVHTTKREMHTVLLYQHDGTSGNVHVASSKRLHLTRATAEIEDEDKSTSDDEGRRCRKPRVANFEGNETNFGNAFDNIPIPSDIPIDLTKVGDIDFVMGASFNIDNAMIEEGILPLIVLTNRTTPGRGKEIRIERNLVKRGNSSSPMQTHHSIDGPSTFEINAKTLGIPLDAKGIFTSAIKILGNEYLTLLKQTPFDKVSNRHGEASHVYKAIRVMHDDLERMKCKVDEYVWAVKGHLSLNASLSDCLHSDQVEEERVAVVEELKLAESNYNATLTKHKGLEEESVT